MMGAKRVAEIITISTNFSSCFSYYQDECIFFNFSLLDLDLCLE